jgi:hypothetical protein
VTGARPDDDFVAVGSPVKRLFLLLLTLLFVAVGLGLTGLLGFDPGATDDHEGMIADLSALLGISQAGIVHVLGWLCLLLFGFFAVLHARRLFDCGPEICAGPSGFWWRRYSDARIPWDAIDTAIVQNVINNKFVCIWLREPALYPRRGPKFGQGSRGTNGDIRCILQGTDGKLDDLVLTIRKYRPDIRIY